MLAKFANFVHFCITVRLPQNGRLPVNFRHFVVSVIQKCTKSANFASVYFPCFTIYHVLSKKSHGVCVIIPKR